MSQQMTMDVLFEMIEPGRESVLPKKTSNSILSIQSVIVRLSFPFVAAVFFQSSRVIKLLSQGIGDIA